MSPPTLSGTQHLETSGPGTTTMTKDGAVVTSTDPSTAPDASIAQKLKGDVSGAVSGSVGSVQAAAGATLRNKNMQEKGLDKMAAEDERLAAKKGSLPVGADKRLEKTEGGALP
ncbi:Uu.00g111350.m01.CDS01 [Anthostomella pinea]|uniref:Uu.00g111350.m01.CDS01 n=1 Tax=Anthostomella pinea TaxID=933095 RepID=A0AAI8V9X6_9PEZI|nr:Uu.00g111350.m01.CDS01 [Anthostomella pinea]